MRRGRQAGFVDWNTKIVLNWQADGDGYRVERRNARHRLYLVANGGQPRHYTAHAWKEDILFDLANMVAGPFPWSKFEEEAASDVPVYPFSSVAEEIVTSSDGVIAGRVLAFANQWGLLSRPHREQPLSTLLDLAYGMWAALKSTREDGLQPTGGLQRARVTQEVDQQGRAYLLASASSLYDFCCLEFLEYAGIRGSYYHCANPRCGKFGPNPKAVNPDVGGRPRKYCSEACDKVLSRLNAKARSKHARS